jgi:hypothetical protein
MKRDYMKPAMTVVKIQQQGIICTSASRQGYGTANDGVDSNELDSDGTWNWD